MSAETLTADTQHQDRLARRLADLYATDAEFAAATPSAAVNAAVQAPGLRLPGIVRTVLTGYADRPALGSRAVEFVSDPVTGRTIATLQPRFETITHGELWHRAQAVANAWHDNPVRVGDRVAILGFTSVDYTVVDTALILLGAVSVPLQTSAARTQLQPIVAETEPVLIATSIDYLDDAVELVLGAGSSGATRLVVFDYLAQVDDQREALRVASDRLTARLGARAEVETLDEVLARGAALPAVDEAVGAGPDPLSLLIYTSGSTGAPKGAMYPEHKVADIWRPAGAAQFDDTQGVIPSIALSFLPMSHVMGRGLLYATLASGGTVNFAARTDLSTLLEDLALTRPTQLNFVPRIWDMLFQEYQSRVAHAAAGADVLADMRRHLLGGRYVSAMTGSAPIASELKAWVEALLGMPLLEGYGSTEAGPVFVDGRISRPPVTDYKLVDVPELGYFGTDVPHPRGELLVKSDQLFPGYYKRPEVTAQVFDADGFYRTGDIVAELGPDQVAYIDRRNNVIKLSQGEFVTVSRLEAALSTSPLVRQIYVYGNSARPYLLAVVVPTEEARQRHRNGELKTAIAASLKDAARAADLQSYEIPRDFLVETTPFTLENGLLTGIRKLAWPKLKECYGAQLEQLYAEFADGQVAELQALRATGPDVSVLETVSRAASAVLGALSADMSAAAHFADLGGDSLSALTFGNLLRDIFDVEVPVGVIVSPASDLQAIADHIAAQRAGTDSRPTFAGVHGRGATEVHAVDLTLNKFIDDEILSAAPELPRPGPEIGTVLLTGATGFLGRYLALDWLQRLALVDGKLICLVRAKSDEQARARLDATFDGADPKLLAHYRSLADHLEVIAGDKGEHNLGLDQQTWQRLADTVDFIVDPAALVNHVLPYQELFGPNALGTAELIRVALTTRIKPFAYVSTIGVGAGIPPGEFVEDADVRRMSATRQIDDSYANGYGTSKWAGEVLLREAHELCGLPVSVFRCDMILADTSHAGQLNLPDMFTRLMLSLVATGIAPGSFNQLDADGSRQRSHYDGLPVEFIAEAIDTLAAQAAVDSEGAFETFHVMNPHDDGVGLDEFVDWLIDAGYPIRRIGDYPDWLSRFETALRGLPDKQRQASLLPLLHNYTTPGVPVNGAMAPTEVFRTAVQDAKIGPDKDIPHVGRDIIIKYVTDLELLGLL